MAFYDDPNFIMSHIRNSYITSDDTGMCEIVIVNEDVAPKIKLRKTVLPAWVSESSGSSMESNNADLSQSYDIASDMDIGAHRMRSNTAQRLDRLKKERQSQAMIKHVHWRASTEVQSEDDLDQSFKIKEVRIGPRPKGISLLSEQLDKCPVFPTNPFSQYAKFDGRSALSVPTRKLAIYLTMLPPAEQAYPMHVVAITTSTRIQELAGLICWQYTEEKRSPRLKYSVDHYSLHIAEDDGEVDWDFPCLDQKDIVSKYGFVTLALVEKKIADVPNCEINISIHIPGEGTRALSIESLKLTVRDVIERTVRRKFGGPKTNPTREYRLEKRSEPGVKLGNNVTLASLDCLSFLLLKDNGKDEDKDDWPHNGMAVMEAPLYQSYLVSILSRVRPKTGIHLGISGEKIEIDPVQRPTSAKLIWSRTQKPVSYDIDVIASCDVLENKSTGKSTFRLVYVLQGQDYKHHDFETDTPAASEIVQKVNHILGMRASPVRRDYLAVKGRKANQRRSFNLGNVRE